MANQIIKLTKKYWLFLVFGFFTLLRLPSLFEPFTYGDEGIYLALGQAARKGLVFYRDIHDNKPPMIYLIAALAGNFSNYRLLFFFWSLATTFIFYQLSQAVFKKNLFAIMMTTFTFVFLSNIHTFEGNVANAENFMLLPTIAAFWLIYRFKNPPLKIWFASGILLSLATLFKVPAAFEFAALLILLLISFFDQKEKNYLLYTKRSLCLITGFFLPILLTFLYYASKNSLKDYLTAAFFQNLPYLSSWSTSQPQASGLPLFLLMRGLVVFLLVIIIFILRKKISSAVKLISIWFAFSWFAALLSLRPYPHYLIQIMPALSLSFGFFFIESKKEFKKIFIPVALLIVFILTFKGLYFWSYPNQPYYFNFYQYALGQKNQKDYFNDFDGRANDIYQVASYLQSHNHVEEKIFIWGNLSSLYPLARRSPVGRYAVAYHIIDFDGYQETMQVLQKQKPQYIIVDPQEERPFPEFFSWLEQNYALEKKIGVFQFYHRLF